jgi:hypothetical protein
VRVLAPTRKIIYTDVTGKNFDFGYGEMPILATFDNKDASYSLHSGSANEYFFQQDTVDMPWEAALDHDGSGFIEASTPFLRYRKMFCWGNHQGGRHWQEFLAPGGHPYLEIQAGIAPTQLHGLNMPAKADWHWTQIFGLFQGDAAQVHAPDWEAACHSVDQALKAQLSPAQLQAIDALYAQRADIPATHIVQIGSGWGAVELARRQVQPAPAVPASFVFPTATMGAEHAKWLQLLTAGHLPSQAPTALPGEWMVQPEWQTLLETSPHTAQDWYALLHVGVMRLEHFDAVGARVAWQASLALQPSAWAWRNLAVLARWDGDMAEAQRCMHQAWQLSPDTMEIAQEYMELLCAADLFGEADAVYQALPLAVQQHDRIQILRGRIALELGDLATVEQLMHHEYAVVREGETELSDIWFGMWYRRLASERGTPLSDAEKAEVRKNYPPPAHIDFRSISK